MVIGESVRSHDRVEPGDDASGPTDWRKSSAKEAKPRARRGDADWNAPRETIHAGLPLKVKLAAWLVALIAGVVLYVVWLLYLPARTPFVAMVVTDYESPVPPNGWAREDLDRFQGLDSQDEVVTFAECQYDKYSNGDDSFAALRERINRIGRGGGPNKNVMIVYLSMHGVINAKGESCLLPPDGDIYETEGWHRLADVLEYLFPPASRRKLPKYKLLLLDCNRIDSHWQSGLLHNGFARGIQSAVRNAEIPGLIVLNSTGTGWDCQQGRVSPEILEGSVFGYYVHEALRGVADAEGSGNGDGEVSLEELEDYLRDNIRYWVLERYDDTQVPEVITDDASLGSFTNLAVTHAKNTSPTAIPDVVEEDRVVWESIAESWERIDPSGALPEHPLRLEAARHLMLQWEALSQAGKAYADQAQEARNRAASRVGDLDVPSFSNRIPAHSLPSLTRHSSPSQLGQEQGVLRDAWDEEKREFVLKGGKDISDAAVVNYLLERCLESPSRIRPSTPADEWPAITDLFSTVSPSDIIELHFLKMLRAHLHPSTWQGNPERIVNAIRSRRLAEAAAFPNDPRAQYWCRGPVARGDAARRIAEDALFVGPASNAGLQDGVIGAQAYKSAQDRADRITKAYRLRDEIWSSLPYLGQWLFGRVRPKGAEDHVETFYDLIEKTVQLSDCLVGQELVSEIQDRLPSDGRAKEARDLFEKLTSALKADLSKVDSKSDLPAAVSLLAIPPVAGNGYDRRRQIRRSYEEVIRSGSREFSPGGSEDLPEPTTDTERVRLDIFVEHEFHPALAILLSRGDVKAMLSPAESLEIAVDSQIRDMKILEEKRKAVYEKLCLQGELVRRLLKRTQADAEKELAEIYNVMKRKDASQPLTAYRPDTCRAERIMRISAPLLHLEPLPWGDGEKNPIGILGVIDAQSLMLWQAERTLDDFWEGYFDRVAEDYLRGAEKLFPNTSWTLNGEPVDLRNLQMSRITAAREPIKLELDDVEVDPKDTSSTTPLAVIHWRPADGLPGGEIANTVLTPEDDEVEVVSTANGTLLSCPRFPLNVPLEGEYTPQVSAGNGALLESTGRWSVRSLFRGHQYHSGTFRVSPVDAGLLVIHEPPRYGAPTVQVSGDAAESSTIVFVLDCSASMKKTMKGLKEQTGSGRTSGSTRIREARDILLRMLDDLAGYDGKFRVGLYAYGHRVDSKGEQTWDYSADPPDFRPWDQGNGDPRPEDDFQQIRRPEKFDRRGYRELADKLRRLEPVGATPLYHAIFSVIDDLIAIPNRGKTHVIVITDGVDWRYGLDKEGEYSADHEKVREKLVTANRENIRLDILGFAYSKLDHRAILEEQEVDVDKYLPKLDERYRHMTDLPRLADGEFQNPQSASLLNEDLKASLQLRRFEVQNVRSQQYATKEPVRLNDVVKLEWDSNPIVQYHVQVVGIEPPAETDIWLKGGEAIDLHLSEDLRHLEHERYTDNAREEDAIVCEAPAGLDGPAEFYIASHGASWVAGEATVEFRFSIQNNRETEFSPRPAEAWIEIRATIDGIPVPDKVYHFYDLTFEENRPVPVLACKAYDWPEEADASVRIWFKLITTEPADQGIVSALGSKERFTVDGIDGVEFQVRTLRDDDGGNPRVVVVENHKQVQGDLKAAKVEIDHTPLKIRREFIQKIGKVEHTFFFDDPEAQRIEGYGVLFTSTRDLFDKGKCISFPDGRSLTVKVPSR